MSRILASLAEADNFSAGDETSSPCASVNSGSRTSAQSDISVRDMLRNVRSVRGWHKEDDGEEEPMRPARSPVHQQELDEDGQPNLASRPQSSSDTSLEVITVEEDRESPEWLEEEFDQVVNSVLNVVREEDSNSSSSSSLHTSCMPTLEITKPKDSKLPPSNRSTNSSLRDTEESSSDSSDDGENSLRLGFGTHPEILKKIIIEPRNQRAAMLRNHFSLSRVAARRKSSQSTESKANNDERRTKLDTVDMRIPRDSVEAQHVSVEVPPESHTAPAQTKFGLRRRLSFSRLMPQRSLRGLFRRGKSKGGKRASTTEEETIDFGTSERKLLPIQVGETAEVDSDESNVENEETLSSVECRKTRSSDVHFCNLSHHTSERNHSKYLKGGDPVTAIPEEPTGSRGRGFWERFRPMRHVPVLPPLPALSTTPAEEKHNQELLTQALAPIVPAQVLEFTVCNPAPIEFTVCNVSKNTEVSVIDPPEEYLTTRLQESPKESVEDLKEFTVCSSENIPKLPLTVAEEQGANFKKIDGADEVQVARVTEDRFDSSSTSEDANKLQGLDFVENSPTEEEIPPQQVDNERSLTDFSPIELQLSAKIGEELVGQYGPYPTKARFAKEFEALSSELQAAFSGIKEAWQDDWALKHRRSKQPWSDDIILRVATFTDFSLEKAVELLRRMPSKHWHNTERRLADDLKSIAVVPLPKLTTKMATDVVYLCPARYNTSVKPIRLLTYAMNCMYDRHGSAPSNCKVALLMNMEGYNFSSKQQEAFAFTDWISWMEFIQGKNGPLSVAEILLVNVSTEFKLVWKARLRSKCQEGFQERFNFIEDATKLDKYLQPGFEQYLPADLPRGQASVQKLVRDFSMYRQALEEIVLGNAEVEDTDSDKETLESGSDLSDRRIETTRPARPRIKSSKRASSSSGHRWEISGNSSSPPVLPDHRRGLDRPTSAESIRVSSGSSHRRQTPCVPTLRSMPGSKEKKKIDSPCETRSRDLAVANRIREFDLGVHRRDVNRTMSSKSLPESRKVRDRKSDVCRQASMPTVKSSKSSSSSSRRSSPSSLRSGRISREKVSSSLSVSRSDRRRDMSRARSANMLNVSKSPKKSSRHRLMKRTISLPSLPETIKEEEEEEEDLSTNSGTLRQIPRTSSILVTKDSHEDTEDDLFLSSKSLSSPQSQPRNYTVPRMSTSLSETSKTKVHSGPPKSHGEPRKRSGSSMSV